MSERAVWRFYSKSLSQSFDNLASTTTCYMQSITYDFLLIFRKVNFSRSLNDCFWKLILFVIAESKANGALTSGGNQHFQNNFAKNKFGRLVKKGQHYSLKITVTWLTVPKCPRLAASQLSSFNSNSVVNHPPKYVKIQAVFASHCQVVKQHEETHVNWAEKSILTDNSKKNTRAEKRKVN